MRHTWKETWSGLRRNLTMTIAVIVTMWVSLTLFGAGLLATQQVDLWKGRWYDKIEITVFLCNKSTVHVNCTPDRDVTDAEKQAIDSTLKSNPEVQEVFFESKEMAFKEFQKTYHDSAIRDTLTQDQMQEGFRVKLKNPEEYKGVVAAVSDLKGVQMVQDLHSILDPLFRWLNIAKWTAISASALLLLAAALQIANTIRMAAFARRRELGIMRLVGASNFAIMLPFLLESLISGMIGSLLSAVTLFSAVYFIVVRKAQPSMQSLQWVGLPEAGWAVLGVILVGILLSIVPTLIATRRYLRV